MDNSWVPFATSPNPTTEAVPMEAPSARRSRVAAVFGGARRLNGQCESAYAVADPVLAAGMPAASPAPDNAASNVRRECTGQPWQAEQPRTIWLNTAYVVPVALSSVPGPLSVTPDLTT